jgi:ketosteroid isomerase-like protein
METCKQVVLRALRAVEERRPDELASLYHPKIEFHWQPGLPYSGHFTGKEVAQMSALFAQIWMPLQPDSATRAMSPRVVASGEDGSVVVSYIWSGRDRTGRSFSTDTLAHYIVKDELLVSARMYYYDLQGLISFLRGAE